MRSIFLSLFVFAASSQAGSITASVTSTAATGAGVVPCSMASAGSLVTCTSSHASDNSSSTASAAFTSNGGDASVGASASGGGLEGVDQAYANAGFTEALLITGPVAGNTIFGHYVYSYSEQSTYGDIDVVITLLQGSSSAQGLVPPGPQTSSSVSNSPFVISSAVQAGVPFVEALSLFAGASTPGIETSSASLQFTGFTDQNGKPIAYEIVPEPGSLLLFASGIGVLLLVARRRKPAR